MATHNYPESLIPQSMEWRSLKAAIQSRSPFTGAVEGVEFAAERFAWTLTLPERRQANAAEAQAFFARIAGGIERVRMRAFTRSIPRGTLRGLPTLAAPVERGALSLQIAGSGTLRAGDLFGVGDQVFMNFQHCGDIAGVITVQLVHRARKAIPAGTAVVWDKPTFLVNLPTPSSSLSLRPGAAAGMTVELVEVW